MPILTQRHPSDHCPHCFADTGRSQNLRTRDIECVECGHLERTKPPAPADTGTVPALRMLRKQAD